MKRIAITAVFSAIVAMTQAQVLRQTDSLTFFYSTSPWCVDLNLNAGALNHSINGGSFNAAYLNVLTSGSGQFKFEKGYVVGADAQIGYFFGESQHFGVGTGLKFQIPLVVKYKTMLIDRLGLTADAGLLINLAFSQGYKTNASFDYEAIYKYNPESGQYVYDDSIPYSKNDVLYTKAATKSSNVTQTFDTLRAAGLNVGIGQRPNSSSGKVSANGISVGFLFRPALTYYVTERLSINLGLYFTYQNVNEAQQTAYKITDKVGQYSSLLNNLSSDKQLIVGANAGLRFNLGKNRDKDHDGIPDKFDRCPQVWGLPAFKGCPDSDMDGIPDIDDSCPHEKGLAKFNGCPDTDGDGIIDKNDSCPYQYGLAIFNGCPDADGDGIPDQMDSCPHQPGLALFNGCPDSDGDGIPDNLDACPFLAGIAANHGCPEGYNRDSAKAAVTESPAKATDKPRNLHTSVVAELDRKQIHFDFNKATINKSSTKYLESVLMELRENPEAVLTIDGFADNIGSKKANLAMSKKRAQSVKNYFVKKGIAEDRLQARGHGNRMPIGNNRTRSGRAKNRRALMVIRSSTFDKKGKQVPNTSAISVYPNEERGSFTIILKTNFEENAVVTITNSKGKVVKEFNIIANKPTEFTLEEADGLYSFSAATATTRYEAKIIISQ